MKYPIFDRLQLLKIGYVKGVSLSWLSQQNNFFAMNLLELVDQQIIPSTCEKYFDEAYTVWEQQVALNNKKIASERWNSEAMLCQLIYSISKYSRPCGSGLYLCLYRMYLIYLNGFSDQCQTRVKSM